MKLNEISLTEASNYKWLDCDCVDAETDDGQTIHQRETNWDPDTGQRYTEWVCNNCSKGKVLRKPKPRKPGHYSAKQKQELAKFKHEIYTIYCGENEEVKKFEVEEIAPGYGIKRYFAYGLQF